VLLAAVLCLNMLSPVAAFAGDGDAQAQPDAASSQAAGLFVADGLSAEQPAADDPPVEQLTNGSQEETPQHEAPQQEGQFATLAEAVQAEAVAAVPENPEAFVSNEIIVVLVDSVSEEEGLAAIEEEIDEASDATDASSGTSSEPLEGALDGQSAAVVFLPADVSVADALLVAANSEEVAFAQPNFRYQLLEDSPLEDSPLEDSSSAYEPRYTPNDPEVINTQWWLGNVNALQAWDLLPSSLTTPTTPVTVAVIDTGMRLTHQDLAGSLNLASGDSDFSNGSAVAWDTTGSTDKPLTTAVGNGGDNARHGTHVAGIIAAEANNNILGAGVSGNAARLLPIRVFSETVTTTDTIVRAYSFLLAKRTTYNIRVVNMSLGGYGSANQDPMLHQKIKDAQGEGILTVVAAGNYGSLSTYPNYQDSAGNTITSYPSDYDEVISVTAVDSSNAHAYFSDHNSYKDIAAPGHEIHSTVPSTDTDFGQMSGTSMAAPVVSGIAAMLFAINPNLTVAEVKSILYGTARDQIGGSYDTSGWDPYFGWGVVDANAALQAVASGEDYPTVTPSATPTAPVSASLPSKNCYPGTYFPSLNATATNAAAITAEGGSLSYQWYYNIASINSTSDVIWSGVKIDGATNATYQPAASTPTADWQDSSGKARTGVYFFCKVTNTLGGKSAGTVSNIAYYDAPYSKTSTMTLTASSDTKAYDGTPLVKNTYSRSSYPSGVAAVSVWVSGSQTAVGASANEVTKYKLYADTGKAIEVTSYYTNITTVPGTLTVTPNDTLLTLTAASASKPYDGTSLNASGFTASTLPSGVAAVSVLASGSQTEPGQSANEIIDFKLYADADKINDITSYYTNVETADGTLTVTPNDTLLTLTAASVSKPYDGTSLSASNFTTSTLPSGVAAVSATVSGSQTELGQSANEITSYKLYADAEKTVDVTEYYTNVVTAEGILTVTTSDALPIVITAASASKP
jgi:serine protease